MNKDVGFFIPTYKNRYHELFDYIINGNLKDYEIFIVLSECDEHLDEYYQYRFPKNVKTLKTDCKLIGEKRQYILDFAKSKKIRYVVEADDDVREFGYKITPESKRTTSESYSKIKIPLVELIDKMVKYLKDSKYAFVSPSFPFSLGFKTPGSISVNSGLNFGQLISFDVNALDEINFKYDVSPYVIEDIDMVFHLLMNCKICATFGDHAFEVIGNSSKLNTSIVLTNGTETLDLKTMNMYLKYGDGMTLVVGSRGELRMNIRLKNYWGITDIPIKNDEYHNKLRELCRNKDVEAVKELIRSKKFKKN